jgi:transcriptional regulator with XRE-family HTH domain
VTNADEHDEQQRRRQVADVVLYWMRRRGLTRKVFADRLGKSVSWIDKIKNGDRQLDRLSVLRHIAQVLDIPLHTLIDTGEAERRRLCPDDRDVDAIRTAQAAVWQLDGDDQRAARRWLAWTYQLTAATAFKLGDAQLGWVAADRGIQFAEQTEDLTLIGSAARWVAHALTDTYRSSDAVAMVRSAADRLSPHLGLADAAFVSAYGMLLLKGSIAAAQLHQATDVRDLQAEALNVALRLGTDRDAHWSSFGATNVRVHQVSALADMHSGGRVLEAAGRISGADLMSLPKERRASHLVDVTRGYVQAGKRDEAVTALLDADQFAPGEVRCRHTTHRLVEDLVRSYPRGSRPPAALAKLARAVGVTE